ncbi:MAG: hypothetical protein ACYSVY_24255 [Planctomycetota bacterium]
MGWETRRNGRYFYRKRRYGRRVVSEYVGTGPIAEIVADLAEADREEARHRREEERRAIQQAEAADAELVQLCELLRQRTFAALERAGFHRHKGQWRRRRHARA